ESDTKIEPIETLPIKQRDQASMESDIMAMLNSMSKSPTSSSYQPSTSSDINSNSQTQTLAVNPALDDFSEFVSNEDEFDNFEFPTDSNQSLPPMGFPTDSNLSFPPVEIGKSDLDVPRVTSASPMDHTRLNAWAKILEAHCA